MGLWALFAQRIFKELRPYIRRIELISECVEIEERFELQN